MKDLNFISTDALLDELSSRYEQYVFMGTKSQKDNEIWKRKYKGTLPACLGLCTLIQQLLTEDWTKQQKELPTEET